MPRDYDAMRVHIDVCLRSALHACLSCLLVILLLNLVQMLTNMHAMFI